MTDQTNQTRLSDQTILAQSLSGSEPFLRGMLASFVLLLLASTIERVFFGANYYASLVQHPFWIVVLLASLQSGLYVGVATAGMAAVMMDWPSRPIGTDITAHYIEVAILPLQWLLAALCIGLFRQAELKRSDELVSENLRLHDLNDALANEIQHADAAREAAELRVVTQVTEQGYSLEAVKGLFSLQQTPPDALGARFKEVVDLFSPLSSALLLTNASGGLESSSEGLSFSGLALSRQTLSDPVEAILASGGATVLAGEIFDLPDSFLAIASIAGPRDHVPAGAIVFLAERREDAEAICPIADLMARAIEHSLNQAGRSAFIAPALVEVPRRAGQRGRNGAR